MPSRPLFLKNLTWGLGWGLSMAAAYSLYVLALFHFAGPSAFEPDSLSPTLSLNSVLLAYLAGGVLGGLLLGLLRPMAASLLGSLLLGLIIGIPVMAGIEMATSGLDALLTHRGLFVVFVGAATLGPLCAYGVYRRPYIR